MVNYNDSSRTLSGVDERSVVSLVLPSSVAAISIGGNVGEKGQVIAKNNITNKIEWDSVDDISIPDGSIEGKKLAPNISFTTTGNITLSNPNNNGTLLSQILSYSIGLTGYGNIAFRQLVGSATNWFEYIASSGKFIINNIIDLNGTLKSINGNLIDLYSDNGNTKKIELNGANGNITSVGGDTTLHNTTIQNSLIVEGNGIFTTDISGSGDANAPYKYTLDGSTGNILCNDIDCQDITIANNILLNDIRTNKIQLPKSGAVVCEILTNGNIITNGNITGASIAGTSLSSGTTITATGNISTSSGNLSIAGTSTLDGNISSTNGNLTLTNGNLSVGGTSTLSGNITSNNGNITLSNGDLIVGGDTTITGETLLKGGCEFRGDNAIDFVNSNSDLTMRITGSNGNILNTNGNLTLTNGDLSVGGTTTTENIIMNGNLTSTNGNITLTNGTLFGNVAGTITEETIDCQVLNFRQDPTGNTGGITALNFNVANTETGNITMNYASGATGTSGITINDLGANTFSVEKTGTIGNCLSIIMRGPIFNNVNSGRFSMGTTNCIMSNSTALGNTSSDKLFLKFGSNSGDSSEIRLRNNNVNRVVLDDDIRLFNSIQTETIHLISQSGNIQLDGDVNVGNDVLFDNDSGELKGHNSVDAGTFLNNYTECDDLYLGDNSNILYSNTSIAHSLTTTECTLQITNTPTSWIDLNDKLQISYSSKARPVNLLITFNYYCLLTAGAELYLKLWDTIGTITNAAQPSYLANTTQKVYDNIHGADDERWRSTTFIVEFPANTSKSFRVAARPVATGGHHAKFYIGALQKTTEPTSNNTKMYGGMSLQLMATDTGNLNTTTPTGWTEPKAF